MEILRLDGRVPAPPSQTPTGRVATDFTATTPARKRVMMSEAHNVGGSPGKYLAFNTLGCIVVIVLSAIGLLTLSHGGEHEEAPPEPVLATTLEIDEATIVPSVFTNTILGGSHVHLHERVEKSIPVLRVQTIAYKFTQYVEWKASTK